MLRFRLFALSALSDFLMRHEKIMLGYNNHQERHSRPITPSLSE